MGVIKVRRTLVAESAPVDEGTVSSEDFYYYETSEENAHYWNSLNSVDKKAILDKAKSERVDIRILIHLSRMAQYSAGGMVLISALSKEKDALEAKVSELSVFIQRGTEDGSVRLSDRKSHKTVAVLKAIRRTGNVASMEVLRELIRIYKPKIVVLFGIAAGIRKRVKMGDTIITDRVWDLRKCSILEKPTRFKFEPQLLSPTKSLALPFQVKGLEEKLGNEFKQDIRVFDDFIIGSSDTLTRNRDFMKAAAGTHRKLAALEMEAAGIAEVCNSYNIPFFIVKVISDYGDEKKDDSYHKFCCQVAASTVLHGFLLSHLNSATAVLHHRDQPKTHTGRT